MNCCSKYDIIGVTTTSFESFDDVLILVWSDGIVVGLILKDRNEVSQWSRLVKNGLPDSLCLWRHNMFVGLLLELILVANFGNDRVSLRLECFTARYNLMYD